MNRRQAKKKHKKEQQMEEAYAAALEQLPEIAQIISEGIKEALDRLCKAIDHAVTLITHEGTIRDYYSKNKEARNE